MDLLRLGFWSSGDPVFLKLREKIKNVYPAPFPNTPIEGDGFISICKIS